MASSLLEVTQVIKDTRRAVAVLLKQSDSFLTLVYSQDCKKSVSCNCDSREVVSQQ